VCKDTGAPSRRAGCLGNRLGNRLGNGLGNYVGNVRPLRRFLVGRNAANAIPIRRHVVIAPRAHVVIAPRAYGECDGGVLMLVGKTGYGA
jgi:hypothetical protein